MRDAVCAKHVPPFWFDTVKEVARDNCGLGMG